MMNKMKTTVCALAVLAASSSAAFAESVDVIVTGTITPSACTPAISGGGVIDYGAIAPSTLNPTNYTVLAEKTLAFSIVCDAPAKVAIQTRSSRPGSIAGGIAGLGSGIGVEQLPSGVVLFGYTSIYGVGLGFDVDGTTKIGGYGMRIKPNSVLVDDVAATQLFSNNFYSSTSSWTVATSGTLFNTGVHPRVITWADTGTTVPKAFTTMTGTLGVQAYINYISELDLTHPIVLDGLSTIELVYL
ncbi:MAG: DUF1120 domain-containing protein [Enterobacteriaceae bacterium]|jgi:hypothetical protein|nr:DUF1120 domain-containing protein [Enterobacteriaceae bacterium]